MHSHRRLNRSVLHDASRVLTLVTWYHLLQTVKNCLNPKTPGECCSNVLVSSFILLDRL
jgi:hypothetical protein